MENDKNSLLKYDDPKVKKQVMEFDGKVFINFVMKLYDEIGKEIKEISKREDEVAKSIKIAYQKKLDFIKEAWRDSELTKHEKKKIYQDFMDKSESLNQYLIDKDKKIENRIKKKEVVRDITIGAVLIAITATAA